MRNKSKAAIKAAQKRSNRAKKTKGYNRQERAQKNASNRERNINWNNEMSTAPFGEMTAPFGFFADLKQYQPIPNIAQNSAMWNETLAAAKIALDCDDNVVGISFWRNNEGDETMMTETSLPKHGETNFMTREEIMTASAKLG